MGLTLNGYERPTYNDILENLVLKARELFGEDIETNEQTLMGKFLRVIAYDRAIAEEEAEQIYYARFPNTASGISLDRLCPFVGIARNPATPAQYSVTVKGTAGYTVPYGFLVATGTDKYIEFYNTQDTIIPDTDVDEEGFATCTIIVECVESGSIGNVAALDIVEIVNPDADIESVTGVESIALGKDEESDSELRQRFLKANAGLGSCNETAIKAALIRVPTVTSVSIIVDEENGSFTAYVTGGESYEQQIAETIFDKKPIGVKTTGTNTVTVMDEGGYTHTIKFSRTEKIDVYTKIEIVTTPEFKGEAGITEIKNNIASYINGLGVGKDIITSSLYGLIYSVTGVEKVILLKVSTDGTTYSTEDISINEYQCAASNNVIVDIVEVN